jgi:catechol 2,3-dioxygenase-like lactoylglutathione lyase family enzyme
VVPDLLGLDAAADPESWRKIGLTVDDGVCTIGGVAVRLGVDGKQITGWALTGVPAGERIDGLRTTVPAPRRAGAAHPNGAVAIDHVVALTPVPERTIAALAAIGLEPRGVRHTDEYGPPFTQTFFRVGRPILELIGPDEPRDDGAADGPARFFGLALTVADLDATAVYLGGRLGRVKDAVQPGRRIATLRREAGAGLPLAFMSPGGTP